METAMSNQQVAELSVDTFAGQSVQIGVQNGVADKGRMYIPPVRRPWPVRQESVRLDRPTERRKLLRTNNSSIWTDGSNLECLILFQMANGHSNARQGAGRPVGRKDPKTLAKEEARELVRQMVTARLARLVEAQMDNAEGLTHLMMRDSKTGKF